MPTAAWRPPAVLLGLQALVLAGLAAALVVTGTTGSSDDIGRAVTEGLTVLALALCCGLLAWGFWRERSLARTPSLLWNALGVIVGITVANSGAPAAGVAIAVVAVATFALSLRVPRYDPADEEG